MTLRYPLACLAAISLAGPTSADIGTLQGTSRQETLPAARSVASYARSWGLAAEQLAWANGLSTEGKTGPKVTLPARILPANPPKNGAVVNLAERGMYLFREGKYRGFFPLAIGREDKAAFHTPTGTFTIVDRQKNPTWVAPKSNWAKALKKEKIAGNDDNNPLGEYWFGFDHPKGGYGFHENLAPETTGDKVSHGCMRLYPEHAKKIFNDKLLVGGDTVRIENRPVVLGKDKSGEIYASVFPATYEAKADLAANLTKALKKEGLLGLLPPDRLKQMAGNRTGVPRSVLGKSVGLMIDGQPSEGKTPALRRDGSVLVPVSLARELDCQVAYDAKTGLIKISKDGKSKTFTLDSKATGPRAFRWGDQTMVAARSLLDGLDIPFIYNGKERQLEIDG